MCVVEHGGQQPQYNFHEVVRTSMGAVLLLPVMLLLPFEVTPEVVASFCLSGPCIPPDFRLGQRGDLHLRTESFAPVTVDQEIPFIVGCSAFAIG